MRLRIEEQFGMDDVVRLGAQEIGPGHVEEVLLVQQHAGAGVVNIEKALQVGERIGGAQRVDAGIGQGHAVALGQREDQFGFQRTFDMDVQLGLGHGAGEGAQRFAVGNWIHGGSAIWHDG
jgi:hypothetical protein